MQQVGLDRGLADEQLRCCLPVSGAARDQLPSARVLVLTTYADDDTILPALRAGAHEYLTKDASAEQIEAAIRAVHAGQTHPGPLVQERLAAAVTGPPPQAPAPGAHPLPAGLTTREAKVLTLLAAGLSNAEIAQRLFVSNATVKTHNNRIFATTGARDRAQAVRYAYRTGLATPLPDLPGARPSAGPGGRRPGTPRRLQAPSPDRGLWRNGSQ